MGLDLLAALDGMHSLGLLHRGVCVCDRKRECVRVCVSVCVCERESDGRGALCKLLPSFLLFSLELSDTNVYEP